MISRYKPVSATRSVTCSDRYSIWSKKYSVCRPTIHAVRTGKIHISLLNCMQRFADTSSLHIKAYLMMIQVISVHI